MRMVRVLCYSWVACGWLQCTQSLAHGGTKSGCGRWRVANCQSITMCCLCVARFCLSDSLTKMVRGQYDLANLRRSTRPPAPTGRWRWKWVPCHSGWVAGGKSCVLDRVCHSIIIRSLCAAGSPRVPLPSTQEPTPSASRYYSAVCPRKRPPRADKAARRRAPLVSTHEINGIVSTPYLQHVLRFTRNTTIFIITTACSFHISSTNATALCTSRGTVRMHA